MSIGMAAKTVRLLRRISRNSCHCNVHPRKNRKTLTVFEGLATEQTTESIESAGFPRSLKHPAAVWQSRPGWRFCYHRYLP